MEKKGITVNELQNKYKERCSSWYKIFDKILTRCYREIDVAFKNTEPYCIFQVPEYLLGIGSYNVVYCSVYLIKSLKDNGFNIKFFDPNILFISWSYTPKMKHLLLTGTGSKSAVKDNITSAGIETLSEIDTEPAPRKEIKITPPLVRQFRNINDYTPSGRFI